MTQYIIYKTKQKDRWDTIAYKFYGNVYKQKALMEANPNIALDVILPPETKILIPVDNETTNETNTEDLPIWKQ